MSKATACIEAQCSRKLIHYKVSPGWRFSTTLKAGKKDEAHDTTRFEGKDDRSFLDKAMDSFGDSFQT
ncbi:MAG: hypothetical protein H7A25_22785 [Leptospiraceae bacterium]|nr:hypothetical protein [Leptospiraceae bacterium]MCP5502743.1 hypothetical protein [Leptospiraceae bacterium]